MYVFIYGLFYNTVNMPDYTASNIRITGRWKKFKGFKIGHTKTKALMWHDGGLNSTTYCTVQNNG